MSWPPVPLVSRKVGSQVLLDELAQRIRAVAAEAGCEVFVFRELETVDHRQQHDRARNELDLVET